MQVLITGCAGFIGYHLTNFLLKKTTYQIIGIDNLNEYYDVKIKVDRLKLLKNSNNFTFHKIDIASKIKTINLFKKYKFDTVVHLAAQAGVRYSIHNPDKYFHSNLLGFYNILESSREIFLKHLIYASTSSVYGKSDKFPLKENFNTDFPLSFYAATKKCNEVLAYSYSNIYKLPCTGLRFFTVYGPYGRPDMALFKFTKNILENNKIQLFNQGNHTRDFTYVDDAVEAISKLISKPKKNKIPYQIFNISSNKPKKLTEFLNIIEKNLFKKAKISKLKMQKGDIKKTHGSIDKINNLINFKTKTSILVGIKNFIKWYRQYYKIK